MTPSEIADELAGAAPDAALLLDFDGTLAPIMSDPRESRPAEGVAPALARLADELAAVAIISGRPVSFLAEHLGHPRLRLLGLYGLEQWHEGAVRPHPDAAGWQPAVDAAREELTASVGRTPGVWVEDKGLAVAVHWRNAADRDAAATAVTEAVADLAGRTGLAREPGKLVEELRPPLAVDKGTAVRAVVPPGARRLVYIGDDVGDLAAFEVLAELGGRCLAVRHGDETPERLVEAADAVLDGSEGVADWLARLAELLS